MARAIHRQGETPRRRTKAGLLAGELLPEAFTEYVFLMDTRGIVLAASETLARTLNVNLERLVGRSIYEFFPPNLAKKRRAVAKQVIRSKTPLRYEDATRSGRILDTRIQPLLDERGEVARLAVFITDATEHARLEKEWVRLASAVEQAGEAFVIVDEAMVIQYVNQAFEEMTGYASKEARGASIGILYRGPDQTRVLRRIESVIGQGETWVGRVDNTRKNGDRFQCEKTVSPVRGKGGVILGYVSVWRDVAELDSLEKQLRLAQKMEALGALAGGIAHDFNNILGPIILHAQLGVTRHPEGDASRNSFEQILEAAERAESLVRQILHLGRAREKDTPVPFRLSHILKECLKILRPSLPSTITIRLDVVEDDYVMADPTQIHQVVMNLCTNAAHSMRESGGELRLAVGKIRMDRKTRLMAPEAEAKDYLRLTVADTGHGIPAKIMHKIFDPFFTTKRGSAGTGLGLAVAQNIVARRGGFIRVESREGAGSAFHVLLPCINTPSPDVGESCRCLELGGDERILLVDDDRSILESATMGLERLGYRVAPCPGGFEALGLFEGSPDAFDIVLANVTMPELTGVDLARALLRLRPDLPIILFSGAAELVTPEQARRLGARDFIMKPFHLEELAASVRRGLGKGREPKPR